VVGIGLAVLAMTGTPPAMAQQAAGPRYQVPPPAPGAQSGKPRERTKIVDMRSSFTDVPGVKPVALPVNPSDPIAIINNQPITRQQLADECVAKEGKKILDTMINRLLIEQALARQKMTVTAADIDAEIDSIAQRFGIDRETWLRTLDKERGISPAQYAREIVYPAKALQKLCRSRVQVTPKDMQEAFESQYGDKLRVRMILVNTQQKAMVIWEELHKNTGGFEAVAKEQSMDPGSKSLGGLLGDPITRHAYPRNVSDGAFRELVDGDPNDRDPTHKPKDGDITGVIQAGESAFIILRREELIPAAKNVNPKDLRVMTQLRDMIYEVKLKDEMEKFFEELIKQASIENRLTGAIKMSNEDLHPEYRVDGDVKLMGGKGGDGEPATRAGGAAPAAGASTKMPRPAALSPEAAKQFRPLKPGGNPTPQPGTGDASQPPAGAGASPQPGGGAQ
jgi:foldase protein PrsA